MTPSQLTTHHAASVSLQLPGETTLAALDTGDDGSKWLPTVLLVPGYTGSKEDFAPILDPLADNGYRALAIDLPGQYQSAGPEQEADYLPQPLGRMVSELVGTLSGPVVLIGHSYGGLVARAAVISGADVAALVLLDSGPAELPDGPRSEAMASGELNLRQSGIQAAYAIRSELTAQLRDPQAQELQEFFRRRFTQSSVSGLLGMASGLRSEPDRTGELSAALAAAGAPVAVISGEGDDAWGIQQQADMARQLGTALVLIPGAEHSPAVQQPECLLQVLLPLLHQWTAAG